MGLLLASTVYQLCHECIVIRHASPVVSRRKGRGRGNWETMDPAG